ncbi:hypothetical protein GCM10027404_24940 [Arthrobacter tumbae]
MNQSQTYEQAAPPQRMTRAHSGGILVLRVPAVKAAFRGHTPNASGWQ